MSERTYGAPLAKDTVRALRERAGLSQEALATRLGLAGKAVVSGWETGRTTCEGPAAELLLHLFAADTSRNFTEINTTIEATWRHAGAWEDAWRQICAVPETPLAIDRDTFASLFPGAEIPTKHHLHGFPFVDVPTTNAFGIGTNGWSGSMPADRDRAPRYLWQLDRTGAFVYRETPWEDLYDSITSGHTHVGSLLELAACTTVFLGRFARTAALDPQWRYSLRLDLEGVHGRGVVASTGTRHGTPPPKMLSRERHLAATFACSVHDIIAEPLQVAYSLVREILIVMRPDLAATEQLAKQLRARLDADQRRDQRLLGFLDEMI